VFGIAIDGETRLELLEEQHAEALFALVDANRAYLREWLPWLDQNTSAEHTRAFIRLNLQQFAARNGFSCGIFHQRRIAGVIGLHHVDWANRKTSIGYWIGQAHQGRGLVTKATAALLDHLFGELGLNCVEIGCAPGNMRSCAIPERLGFTHEGVLRQREWLYDHFVDHRIYSMLADEWRARRAARPTAGREGSWGAGP
jgi:ribosomal-protein-serine acetyltransferase